jgi:hypothetical protein
LLLAFPLSAPFFSDDLFKSWMAAWGKSWVVSYPIQLIVFPVAQKIVSVCILPPNFPDQKPHA